MHVSLCHSSVVMHVTYPPSCMLVSRCTCITGAPHVRSLDSLTYVSLMFSTDWILFLPRTLLNITHQVYSLYKRMVSAHRSLATTLSLDAKSTPHSLTNSALHLHICLQSSSAPSHTSAPTPPHKLHRSSPTALFRRSARLRFHFTRVLSFIHH